MEIHINGWISTQDSVMYRVRSAAREEGLWRSGSVALGMQNVKLKIELLFKPFAIRDSLRKSLWNSFSNLVDTCKLHVLKLYVEVIYEYLFFTRNTKNFTYGWMGY